MIIFQVIENLFKKIKKLIEVKATKVLKNQILVLLLSLKILIHSILKMVEIILEISMKLFNKNQAQLVKFHQIVIISYLPVEFQQTVIYLTPLVKFQSIASSPSLKKNSETFV